VLLEDSAQFESQKIWFPASRLDDVSYPQDVHLSKASSVRTTRTFRPDRPLCQEDSNCSSLHPSGRFNSMSKRLLVFNKLQKISKTQLWEDYCNRSDFVDSRPDVRIHKASIAFKSRHPNNGPHGSDTRASDMEITCIRSTIWTIFLLVRMSEALV
jgi:hypothetical protein